MASLPLLVQLVIEPHGPQWQRKVRILMGTRGQLRTHGTMYCSAEYAALFVRLHLSAYAALASVELLITDSSDAEPVYMTTRREASERGVTAPAGSGSAA